jgi:hypothetical protein
VFLAEIGSFALKFAENGIDPRNRIDQFKQVGILSDK